MGKDTITESEKKKKRKNKKKNIHAEGRDNSPQQHYNWNSSPAGPTVDSLYGPRKNVMMQSASETCVADREVIHKVKKGEGLWPIVRIYFPYLTDEAIDIKVEEIIQYNNLTTTVLEVGQRIAMKQTEGEAEKSVQWRALEAVRSSDGRTSGDTLPKAPQEVKNINAHAEKGVNAVYLENVTEDEFKKKFFNEYHRYWHISTHGEGGSADEAMAPFILTAESFEAHKMLCSKDDGKLTSNEVRKLPLKDVELIFFNACQTALANDKFNTESKQESVTHAALEAGAKNSIATFWKIDDTIAFELANAFYENLFVKQLSIHEALRAAQQLIKEKHPDPYWWASHQVLSKDFTKEDYSAGSMYDDELQDIPEELVNKFEKEEKKAEDRVSKLDKVRAKLIKKSNDIDKEIKENKKDIASKKEGGNVIPGNEDDLKKLEKKEQLLFLKDLEISNKIDRIKLLKEKAKHHAGDRIADKLEGHISSNLVKNLDTPERIQAIKDKLGDDDAVVEIRRTVDSDKRVHYLALVNSSHTENIPKVIVLSNYKNTLETRNYNNALNTTRFKVQDELSFEAFWGDIDKYLSEIKVKNVYLSAEGVYEQLTLNAFQNSQTKKYVFDDFKIITLY